MRASRGDDARNLLVEFTSAANTDPKQATKILRRRRMVDHVLGALGLCLTHLHSHVAGLAPHTLVSRVIAGFHACVCAAFGAALTEVIADARAICFAAFAERALGLWE